MKGKEKEGGEGEGERGKGREKEAVRTNQKGKLNEGKRIISQERTGGRSSP